MEKIFLISGKARHGKNTIGEIIETNLKNKGKTCVTMAYGDYVKYIANKYFNWSGNKDKYGRQLIQSIGQNGRNNNKNIWVDRIIEDIELIQDEIDYIIITDCRYPNEIEIPKQNFGDKAISIRIERQDFISDLTQEQLNHPSETSLDNYSFDYVIKSKNVEDMFELKNKVLKTLKDEL